MKVVFMGTPDFSVGTLEALVEAGYEITGVVTQPDKPKGRGKQMMPTPVKEAAEKHGLPVYQPRRVRDAEAIEEIRKMEPDVIVVVAFGQIITKEILEMPKYGCINVHASLLPAYRGAAPIQWAVMNGDPVSGVTIMKMDEGIDTGEMLSKVEIPLASDETGGSLFDKLSAAGAKLLVETLPKIEKGEITPEKQPKESTTAYARMIKKEDGRIDWTKSAIEIAALCVYKRNTIICDSQIFKGTLCRSICTNLEFFKQIVLLYICILNCKTGLCIFSSCVFIRSISRLPGNLICSPSCYLNWEQFFIYLCIITANTIGIRCSS